MTLTAGVTTADVKRAAEEFATATSFSWSDPKVRRKFTRAMERALTAALEGSVVVPREPTPEIVKAYIAADPRRRRFAASAKRDYRAMIASVVDGGA